MPKQTQSKQVVAYHQEVYAGPLPSPDVFERYEMILPGAAERILTMAETQSQHRQEMERMQLEAEIRDSHRGITFAFILGISCIGVSVAAIAFSPSNAGTILGGVIGVAGIGTIISSFITNTRIDKKN